MSAREWTRLVLAVLVVLCLFSDPLLLLPLAAGVLIAGVAL